MKPEKNGKPVTCKIVSIFVNHKYAQVLGLLNSRLILSVIRSNYNLELPFCLLFCCCCFYLFCSKTSSKTHFMTVFAFMKITENQQYIYENCILFIWSLHTLHTALFYTLFIIYIKKG